MRRVQPADLIKNGRKGKKLPEGRPDGKGVGERMRRPPKGRPEGKVWAKEKRPRKPKAKKEVATRSEEASKTRPAKRSSELSEAKQAGVQHVRERKHAVHGRINKKTPAYTKFSQKDAGENKIAKLSQNYHKNMFRGKIAKPWLSHNTASCHFPIVYQSRFPSESLSHTLPPHSVALGPT